MKSKEFSNEKFKPSYTANKSLSPKLVWYNYKTILKFKGSCLKQKDQAAFTPKNVINVFIIYELDSWPRDLNTDFTLRGCLFGGVKLTKNPDPDKYSYICYNIRFNTQIEYTLPDGRVGENVIIFGGDMSSSVNIDNKGKSIVTLGKGIKQWFNHTLVAETQYLINCTRPSIKCCLSLH